MEIKREVIAAALNPLPAEMEGIASPADIVAAWGILEFIKDRAKAIQEKLEEYGVMYMQSSGLREIEISADAKIILAKEKKELYDTESIYKALAFTPEQQAVLPKTPAWRKTAILADPRTAGAWAQEEFDVLKMKKINPEILKIKKGG
jgi:hypothetical protein